jgi:hypothetical protein
MSDPNDSASTGDGVPLSSNFLEFCVKVRNNDPSILPEGDEPFNIRDLSEREGLELADALLENNNVTYLELKTKKYTKSSAEAMAKYMRTSKHLQHILWDRELDAESWHREEMFCCFLPAFQESKSLKELGIELPVAGRPSNQALENMLTHTQSLRSLSLICPVGRLVEDIAMGAAQSGLKKNTTLRELTLERPRGATTLSPILTSLCDHPLLRRLRLHGYTIDLTGLETVLLSDTSKITELDIHRDGGPPMIGLTRVIQALARRPMLTMLELHCCPLSRDEAKQLGMVLYSISSLQSLALKDRTLGRDALTELAPALYHNTSIKVLDISSNRLDDIESARLLQEIIRRNKTVTTLALSGNPLGKTIGAVDPIAEGLGSNSTLLKIDLSGCALRDDTVSILAQTLGSRNTTLQKLTLGMNSIICTGVGMLLEAMEQNNHHITDLDLRYNRLVGNEGASILARYLGNNAIRQTPHASLFIIAVLTMVGL